MKFFLPLFIYLTYACLLANCSTDKSTICVVNAQKSRYHCNLYGDPKGYFSKMDRDDLLCTSDGELTVFLEACKAHNLLPLRLCSYTGASFFCATNGTYPERLEIMEADNFACLSRQDFERLIEKCRKRQK